jgi:hypothetical protein
MSFQLVDERTEQVITRFFTRSPTITFVAEISGKQYITVSLSEVKEINGVASEESIINTLTIDPDELFGVPLINPDTGENVVINEVPLLMDPQQVYLILYTIFKKAVEKNDILKV